MKGQFNWKRTFQVIEDYLFITLGMLMFVTAWTMFLLPNNLMGGGVSGICAIIHYATGWSMGVMNFTINAILLIIAFLVLGRGFGIKTIYAIIASSLAFQFMPEILPMDFIAEFARSNGKLVCVIFSGVITGVGIGFTFTHGGSTGGTDIIAMIINKYRNITPGRLLLMMDAIIILTSLVVPSYLPDGSLQPITEKVAVVVYALILVGVNGYTVDVYLTGSKQSVQLLIFTKKIEEMANAIAFDLNRGVTLLKSRGWYHKEESEVLMVVARKTDMQIILSTVKEIDPKAFITVCSVMGVFGLGFDTIKSHKKTKKPLEQDEK